MRCRVTAREWRRRGFASILVALTLAAPLGAQQLTDSLVRRPSPALVKYGKWALVAAAIGMGIRAANEHDKADRAFDQLTSYCSSQPAGCPQTPNGGYVDPVAERHYQRSLSGDRNARNWLLGGEATLLGAAGLFVWELSRPKSVPRNIPFNPELRWTPSQTQLRGSVRF